MYIKLYAHKDSGDLALTSGVHNNNLVFMGQLTIAPRRILIAIGEMPQKGR